LETKQTLPRALASAFAASGFAALANEIAASRRLAIPLGADAPALAAVLAALLVGFAIGGALAGTLLARGVDARRLALVVEAGLAACGALAPVALDGITPLVAAGGRALGVGTAAFDGFRFLVALATCLPAAILMGATFPVALRLARAAGLHGAPAAAAVYAPNTLGAALGALATGFALLPLGGYPLAFGGAALASAVSFSLLWHAAPRSSALDEAPPAAVEAGARGGVRRVLVATFLAGFASFAIEVLLARAAIVVFGASTYAYTAILVAFLLGLALGAPFARRAGDDPERARRLLSLTLAASAVLLAIGVFGFQLYLGLGDPFRASNRFPHLSDPRLLPAYQSVVAAVLLLPTALAFGAAFPLAVAAARGPGISPDRASGLVYASNTLGCLAGTLLGTFLVLPWCGSRIGVHLAGLTAIAAGAALPLPSRGGDRATVRPEWIGRLAGLGALLLVFLVTFLSGSRGEAERLFFREGVASTVAVEQSTGADGRPMRSISVNGTVVATEGLLDLRLQRLLGHLPALLHPAPERTLVIGLGSGVTAGSLATTPGVARTDVVELERFVVDAARLFESTNHGIASGKLPGVTLTIADGRTHLLATDARYDVATCDPIHPWVAGAGNLYSRECFEQERSRLAPGGVTALWVPLYKLRTEDVRTVVGTFVDVFRTSALYVTGYDAILLGADGPFPPVSVEALRPRFAKVAASLAEVEVRSVEELLAGFAMDDAALRAFAADAPRNTDARPILEYRAPLLYLTSYATEFLADVRARFVDPASLFGPGARIDAAAAKAAVALRASAIDRFLASVDGNVARAIADASAALRRER